MTGSRLSLLALFGSALFFTGGCGKESESAKAAPPAIVRQPGIALVVLVDTSGSMQAPVPGADGKPTPKIRIAKSTVLAVVKRLEDFAKANPDRTVQVAVYEFSSREGVPLCRPVLPMGKPDAPTAWRELARMKPDGGTPIGEAMVAANRELDLAALASSHLLVVTDGENTDGRAPGDIAREFTRLPLADQPSLYFVAFDVAAAKFAAVKEAGGLLLSASNEAQLKETLEFILGEKILVERPSGTK
jgi:hypothetical protein